MRNDYECLTNTLVLLVATSQASVVQYKRRATYYARQMREIFLQPKNVGTV